jgi:hypothetical protein
MQDPQLLQRRGIMRGLWENERQICGPGRVARVESQHDSTAFKANHEAIRLMHMYLSIELYLWSLI